VADLVWRAAPEPEELDALACACRVEPGRL